MKTTSLIHSFVNKKGQYGALKFFKDSQRIIKIDLKNNFQLHGVLIDFDDYSISIKDKKDNIQIIYKDEICVITECIQVSTK